MTLLLVLLAVGQSAEPLRKSDLVRLLSGSALSQGEIAQLVTRNCLTFSPTERDRQDLRRLGATPPVLTAVNACARRRAGRSSPPARPAARQPPPATPSAPPPPPPPPPPSAERSGFTGGGGQSAVAGTRLPRVLVFEVKDSTGAPLAGVTVTFTGINARPDPAAVASDAEGRARAAVVLGERAGSARVIAPAGADERQVAFNVSAGAAASLALACGPAGPSVRFSIGPEGAVVLRVTAHDAFGNAAPLTGLRAAVADARVFRVTRIAQDSGGGSVTLRAAQAGTTSLAVIASGIRQYWTATVLARGAREPADCR